MKRKPKIALASHIIFSFFKNSKLLKRIIIFHWPMFETIKHLTMDESFHLRFVLKTPLFCFSRCRRCLHHRQIQHCRCRCRCRCHSHRLCSRHRRRRHRRRCCCCRRCRLHCRTKLQNKLFYLEEIKKQQQNSSQVFIPPREE